MIEQSAGVNPRLRLLRLAAVVLALLLFTGLTTAVAATPAPHLNGAGLVIKHGDGRVLYFYVQFSEPEITGEQLLERAGVQLDITPYAGIGTGVCMIVHEGCPSTNCFCKSFAVPSVFWRYHSLNADGKWVFRASGPTQRTVHDGDVDGWSWSSEDGDLPATSIDAISKLNGITRSPVGSAQVATPVSSPIALDTLATPAATSVVTSAAATATPRVAGVAVSENGDTTQVNTVATDQSSSGRTYVWFGAGVVVLLLVAVALALRRRAGEQR
jgi:hypothetical protein